MSSIGFGFTIGKAKKSGGGFDSNAQAFFTATGITDTTQKNAVNQLVLDLKSANIWSKMKAIYPIIGGSSSTHKYNLKDSRDLDAAFRLSFSTGWVHSSNGITGNGSSTFAETFANLSTDFTLYSAHYSAYVRTSTNIGVDMGVTSFVGGVYGNEGWMASNYNNNSFGGFYDQDGPGSIKIASPGSTGFWTSSITSNTFSFLKRNGTTLATSTSGSTPANTTIYLGDAHLQGGTTIVPSNKQYAFFSFGNGLTEAEASSLNTAVVNFQTTLGRNV